jgi:hypothetical protein
MRKWLMGTIGAAALGLLSLAGGAQAAPASQPAHAPSAGGARLPARPGQIGQGRVFGGDGGSSRSGVREAPRRLG